MKKSLLPLLILLILACREEKEVKPNACGWTESIDAIAWIAGLKDSIKDCTCEPAIVQGTYENQTVIFLALTQTATCDYIWTPTLYDCEGHEVRTFTASQDDQKELYEKVTRDVILYKCKH